MDGIATKSLSAGTQVLAYRVLASSLAQTLRWQLIAVNPAKAIRPPRPERPMLNTPDADQMTRILAARDSWIEKPVLLSAATGMRLGETLAVRWVDLDLDMGVVRVTRALDRDFTVTQPKSARSRRTINLPPLAIDALRRWKREQNEQRLVVGEAWTDHDLVVDDGLGAPLRVDSVSSAFATMMRRARSNLLPGSTTYDTGSRHAYWRPASIRRSSPRRSVTRASRSRRTAISTSCRRCRRRPRTRSRRRLGPGRRDAGSTEGLLVAVSTKDVFSMAPSRTRIRNIEIPAGPRTAEGTRR